MDGKQQKSLFSFFNGSGKKKQEKKNNILSSSPIKINTIEKPPTPKEEDNFKEKKDNIISTPEKENILENGNITLTNNKDNNNNNNNKGLPTPNTDKGKKLSSPESLLLLSSPIKRNKKRISYAESDDSEDEIKIDIKKKKKNRRVMSEDSDDDFNFSDIDFESDISTKKQFNNNTNNLKQESQSLEKFSSESSYAPSGDKIKNINKKQSLTSNNKKTFTQHNEERYSWLINIKDADKNPIGSENYDPRTLYIPPSAWAKFTAFEKQYWEVKSTMWDTVVFFKKGKFYELYENDADIGNSQFDLKLAGGGRANMRLCGVPEMSFDYWASSFIAKGYKVAKVDQKESMLAKEMRGKSGSGKEDKVVKRELECILTRGTLVDESMLVDDMSTYCISIKEIHDNDKLPTFGICFVDTATGMFQLSQFKDDADYTKFETLIAQIRPKEVLLEKGSISARALRIIKNNTTLDTLWNYLKPLSEFWDEVITLEELTRGSYFEAKDSDDFSNWPQILLKAKHEYPIAFSATGALVWYLRKLNIDKQLLSMKNFSKYDPLKTSSLVLDGQSLQNLEIFANSFDGGEAGTLFQLLNRCMTPFGKRMLKNWVCHPLLDSKPIIDRLDSVDFLNTNFEAQATLERAFTSLPDLERLLSRIHSDNIKPKDFVRVLEGFEQIAQHLSKLVKDNMVGEMKKLIIKMPSLNEFLQEWNDAFDRNLAKTEGVIIPKKGVEPEFDESYDQIKEIENRLEDKLKEYKKKFRSQQISFRDFGKELYLIEVPSNLISNVPKDWQQMSATAKVKRYWSPEVRSMVRELLEARETHKVIAEQMRNRLYSRFDKNYNTWLKAIQTCARLDCILSLARTSAALGSPSCRPEFIDSERSVIEFKELRHPCISQGIGEDFIPNDISLGGESSKINLLTGANAAGKSTVLRMTCIATIMAQIGCYVPAESARLTAVDRIMTRLGANDNIFAGQSTFFVELAETKKILSEATDRSLLVIDELGRGGSSSDGFAIAEAVLHHIATHIGSLGFFATHYGTLSSSFEHHPEVKAKRMAILVDDNDRRVTFLYKLEDGVSPGSFGMNVAAMCGIENSIIETAEKAAAEMEHTSRMKKLLDESKNGAFIPLGLQSDFNWLLNVSKEETDFSNIKSSIINCILSCIESDT